MSPTPELHLSTLVVAHGPAAALALTDEQVARLSTAKAFLVVVEISGRTARLRLSRMGGENLIGLSKATRAALAVEIGQHVEAVITPDTAERTVELPPELAEALAAEPSLSAAFDGLSFTARKEMARGIGEARRAETRQRRLAAALELLRG